MARISKIPFEITNPDTGVDHGYPTIEVAPALTYDIEPDPGSSFFAISIGPSPGVASWEVSYNATNSNDSFVENVPESDDGTISVGNLFVNADDIYFTPLDGSGSPVAPKSDVSVTVLINGDVFSGTLTETAAAPVAPIVIANAAPSATDASPAILGKASPDAVADGISVVLTSDSKFGSGSGADFTSSSSLALAPDGTLTYTPGKVTGAETGSDTISYVVTDTTTGLSSSHTQTVTLALPHTTVATFSGTGVGLGGYDYGLTIDTAGNLYGYADNGNGDDGAIFEIANGSGKVTKLADFSDRSGTVPASNLLEDAAGNLYGTTEYGGSYGDGTIFELVKGASMTKPLASLTNVGETDDLVRDSAGDLFGTLASDGTDDKGSLFELASGATAITEPFTNLNGYIWPGLAIDAKGDLFGITFGTVTTAGYDRDYSIFEVAAGTTTAKTLASFAAGTDNPGTTLVSDTVGDLYGVVYENDLPVVFELAAGSSTIREIAGLTSFLGDQVALTLDAAGDLFGIDGVSDTGSTVFEVVTGSSTAIPVGEFSVSSSLAEAPFGDLAADADGDLFGTAGGSGGSVFELAGAELPAGPAVTTANSAMVENGQTAAIGNVDTGSGNPLTVALVSDADFATGSKLALDNGVLQYTPGLVTAALVGQDTLNYTVTDTVTGAVTSQTQTVALSDGPGPTVSLATAPTASGTNPAILATAAAGFGNDPLAVQLTSDADFATGSSVTLTNGSLVYTPGLVTTTNAGSDALSYAVTDTVTGAVTTETQTVTLAAPAAPTVTLAAAPSATNASPATLGVTTPGFSNDLLSVTLTSDADFSTGSSLMLLNDTILYTPGVVTTANAGSDMIGYTITDTVTGATSYETQTIALLPAKLTSLSLHSSNGDFSASPGNSVTFDADGNLYGTLAGSGPLLNKPEGGLGAEGTIFELAKGASTISEIPFQDGEDNNPNGVSAIDAAGNLYGTTEAGGSADDGTIFELGNGASSITTLASFGGSDGAYPSAGLITDAAGDLFGTTYQGGSANLGTIFELPKGASAVTTLVSFTNADGVLPVGGLAMDTAGDLFGTTSSAGESGRGTVFELAKGSSSIVTLASFDGSDGENPDGTLTIDAAGNLYGTTSNGSTFNGTVFELIKGASSVTTLARFTGENGANPYGRLNLDAAGNLFGTTISGGSGNSGTVFELAHGASTITTLVTFNGPNGSGPYADLTVDARGNFYGTTFGGGDVYQGTVFEVSDTGFVVAGDPIVVPTANPSVKNGGNVSLGTAATATGSDPVSVSLTSDAAFATGSSLVLSKGSLVYTPGLITAVQAGPDALSYTVTDTVTGATTQETQIVTLDNGPGPVVSEANAPLASNGQAATLGTASSGFGSDALSVALISDADFVAGSSVTLANGSLVYTPGVITTANAGSDTLSYAVTDTVTGAVTTETQTVTLAAPPGPAVTLAAFPLATNATSAVLGTLTAPNGDPLAVSLVSDDDFAAGQSAVSLNSDGTLLYKPGVVTAANAGSDTLVYTVTDQVTGAMSAKTQAVALTPATLTTLAGFTGYSHNHYSFSGLIVDPAGNLFGTTPTGGSADEGTVFELPKGTSSITPLASLTDVNGAVPVAGLIADAAGNLFGTTEEGGSAGEGTVFELVNGASSITPLASFNGTDGGYPLGGLIADSAGNLFGTTDQGGSGGDGTVFELVKGASSITPLVNFTGSIGYLYPFGGLIADAAGDLFGTTLEGGNAGDGAVFELAKGASSITPLASFNGTNGANPFGSLIADAAGDLFGTTDEGGSAGEGTLFELVKGASSITPLASFTESTPNAGLIIDAAGNLFGTTPFGGNAGYGSVFELVNGASSVTTLVSFTGGNGAVPVGGLVVDATGNLFGTTEEGGSTNYGTVFELSNAGFVVAADPVVAPVANLGVENGNTVSLGTAAPATGSDPLSVSLTSDATFSTGSSLVLSNGSLVYTPGLITAAQAGPDVLTYAVTDTVTGATTQETQTVTLDNGPGPVVSQASAPMAANGQAATLGTASPGFGSDALSVALTSDADFVTGSSLTLTSGGLVYTPGVITTANAGSDTLTYSVTDAVTGAVTIETQTVTLVAPAAPSVMLAASSFASNTFAGVLGTVTAPNNDPLVESLTSDSDFGPGESRISSGVPVNDRSTLLYRPGLVTAAEAGSDTLSYTIADTVTGATIQEMQTVTLSNGPGPVVTQASAPIAQNGQPATLGTTIPGFGSDALSVALTSDADFATGSSVMLTNGSLIYTPGVITTANAGSDTLSYVVTDTVTGAVTNETQTVTLAVPATPPTVTLAASPLATNATPAVLGTATAPSGDKLTVSLVSDGDFAAGQSAVSLKSDGTLLYTPGVVTTANAVSDMLVYTVTDQMTGGVSTETQAVTLTPATLTTLASFTGDNGADPNTALSADAAGDLFGTAPGGGSDGLGTVFELAKGASSITPLASFDTARPGSSLVTDAAGDFFGTTPEGGSAGEGTLFELVKNTSSITPLASFVDSNGNYPYGGLIADAAGDLFGTSVHGGSTNDGTVFELVKGTSSITPLASFTGINGYFSTSGLIADAAGDFFGTTQGGGSAGVGTVFELANGASSITPLASFTGSNGVFPLAGLVADAAGDLFGTTENGGSGGEGTIFELARGASSIIPLASFDGSNGAAPFARLIADAAGDLFGTTTIGGTAGYGTVFELVKGASSITTLASFTGSNGATPSADLIADAAGNLYGTTAVGGSADDGTVFELSNTGFVVAADPVVAPVANPGVENGSTVSLGAAAPATGSDPLSVSLTSDAAFATGSTLVLSNDNLVYTPGLITAAQAGPDALSYTVTDVVTGATTQERQTVTLDNGPAPVVTATTAPVATNAEPATLGTALAGFGNDGLAISLTGDSVFGVGAAGGSHLALSNGALLYTPGLVTSANAGTDAVSYTVTDTVTGASTTRTQSVSLDPGPQLAAGSLLIGHGQAEDVTSLVNSLVKPGLPGDTETVVAATGDATLANTRIIYTAPSAGGITSFGFTAQDQNHTTAQGTVAVTVDPGPSAGSVQTAVNVGQTVDLTSLITTAALVGEAGDIVTITGDGTAGTKGSVTLSNGDLTYTANGAALASVAAGSSASDSFTYTLADQLGDTTRGTVKLSITQPVTSVTGPDYGSGTLTQTPGVTSLVASGYGNTINATVGDATISAGSGNATVNGGNNSLTVLFNGYSDKLTGGNGNDTVSGTQGLASVSVGGGNDGVTLGGYVNSVVAGNGNDAVSGGQGNDTITLGNGQDRVSDSGYSNVVTVGTGNDTIVAGAGFDTVKTGGGNDTITLSGYFNNVTTTGGNNTVSSVSNTGGNTLTLGNGNDTVTLGGYNNTVTLGNGTSIVDAGAGNATIVAGTGSTDVTLHGYNNSVSLGAGINTVNGGAGNDVIHLSGGMATLALGGFNDMVFLGGSSATITDTASYLTLGVSPGGTDVIQDFGAARGNIVDLIGGTGGFSSASTIVQALTSDGHGGTLLTLGTSSSIDFVGLTPQAFTVANFRIG